MKFNILTGSNAQDKYDNISVKDNSTFYLLETGIGYFRNKKLFDANISTTDFIDDFNIGDDDSVPTKKAIINYINAILDNKVEYEFDGVSNSSSSSESSGIVNSSMPIGSIVIWGKSIEEIPEDWHICDGEEGTPDLRDKFVLGSGGSHALNSQGGGRNTRTYY